MLINFTDGGLPYSFDRRTGRYRWSEGAAKGQLAPREAVLSLTSRFVTTQGEKLKALGDRLSTGKMQLPEFQREAGELLRLIHSGSAILGKGGIDQLTKEDWDRTIETIKQQCYKGRATDGKPFGIKHLAAEVKSGAVSPAQLSARLAMYARSGKLSYWEMFKRAERAAGRVYGIRKVQPRESCPECIAYAALPPQEIENVIPCGAGCSCRSNCRCEIVGLTLEQAADFAERRYVRDEDGRFAKVPGRSTAIDKAAKRLVSDAKKSNEHLQLILEGGKTYQDILNSNGKAAADRALLKVMAARAKRLPAGKLDTLEQLGKIEKEQAEAKRKQQLDRRYSLENIEKVGRRETKALAKALEAIPPENRFDRITQMMEFKQKLFDRGLPKEAIAKRISQIELVGTAGKEKKQEIRESLIELLRITNNEISTLRTIQSTSSRPFARQAGGLIDVGKGKFNPNALWHEAGHHIEYSNPRIMKAAGEWRDARAAGEVQPLSKIDKQGRYDKDEIAVPGNFIDPYVGKVYIGRATEVVSMGMEFFLKPQRMLLLWEKDRAHFEFMVGVLRA